MGEDAGMGRCRASQGAHPCGHRAGQARRQLKIGKSYRRGCRASALEVPAQRVGCGLAEVPCCLRYVSNFLACDGSDGRLCTHRVSEMPHRPRIREGGGAQGHEALPRRDARVPTPAAAPIFGAACDCLRLARLGEWRGRDPSAKTYDGRIARPSARSLAPTRRWRCCSRRRQTLAAGLWTIFAGCMISGVGALVTARRGRCGGTNVRVLFETGLATSKLGRPSTWRTSSAKSARTAPFLISTL